MLEEEKKKASKPSLTEDRQQQGELVVSEVGLSI